MAPLALARNPRPRVKGRPLGQANTRAWRNALKRAGIKNFRSHDLRRCGPRGTSWRYDLGGPAGARRVEVRTDGERYAHFTPEQLRAVAYSGAAGDELMSERIAEQQAQLEMLMKRRAGLASALSSKDD